MGNIDAGQIKRIHILKNALSMDDETYRQMLGSFSKGSRIVKSSKDLRIGEANRLILELTSMAKKAGVWQDYGRKEKYSELDGRLGFATGKQLRMLEGMWKDVSVFKDTKRRQQAFMQFINRIVKVENVKWIEDWMVEKLVNALVAMGAEKR